MNSLRLKNRINSDDIDDTSPKIEKKLTPGEGGFKLSNN